MSILGRNDESANISLDNMYSYDKTHLYSEYIRACPSVQWSEFSM